MGGGWIRIAVQANGARLLYMAVERTGDAATEPTGVLVVAGGAEHRTAAHEPDTLKIMLLHKEREE